MYQFYDEEDDKADQILDKEGNIAGISTPLITTIMSWRASPLFGTLLFDLN